MNPNAPPPVEATRLVFLHLPRTGGTTLHDTLAPNFRPEECCPERFAQLDRIPPAELAGYRFVSGHYRFDELALIPAPRYLVTVLRDPRERILSLYHYWRRHRAQRVKEPGLDGPRIARQLGLLEFLHSEEWVVVNAIDNSMACQLMGDAVSVGGGRFGTRSARDRAPITPDAVVEGACQALLEFDCVGFTERLDAVHARLARRFGLVPWMLPRLNSRTRVDHLLEPMAEEPVTPEIAARLRELTQLDAAVLAFARSDPRVRRA